MSDITEEPRKQPEDLDFAEGELDDADPEVVAGMKRLALLRTAESAVPDFG